MPMGVYTPARTVDSTCVVMYIHNVGFCIAYLITTGFLRTSNHG